MRPNHLMPRYMLSFAAEGEGQNTPVEATEPPVEGEGPARPIEATEEQL